MSTLAPHSAAMGTAQEQCIHCLRLDPASALAANWAWVPFGTVGTAMDFSRATRGGSREARPDALCREDALRAMTSRASLAPRRLESGGSGGGGRPGRTSARVACRKKSKQERKEMLKALQEQKVSAGASMKDYLEFGRLLGKAPDETIAHVRRKYREAPEVDQEAEELRQRLKQEQAKRERANAMMNAIMSREITWQRDDKGDLVAMSSDLLEVPGGGGQTPFWAKNNRVSPQPWEDTFPGDFMDDEVDLFMEEGGDLDDFFALGDDYVVPEDLDYGTLEMLLADAGISEGVRDSPSRLIDDDEASGSAEATAAKAQAPPEPLLSKPQRGGFDDNMDGDDPEVAQPTDNPEIMNVPELQPQPHRHPSPFAEEMVDMAPQAPDLELQPDRPHLLSATEEAVLAAEELPLPEILGRPATRENSDDPLVSSIDESQILQLPEVLDRPAVRTETDDQQKQPQAVLHDAPTLHPPQALPRPVRELRDETPSGLRQPAVSTEETMQESGHHGLRRNLQASTVDGSKQGGLVPAAKTALSPDSSLKVWQKPKRAVVRQDSAAGGQPDNRDGPAAGTAGPAARTTVDQHGVDSRLIGTSNSAESRTNQGQLIVGGAAALPERIRPPKGGGRSHEQCEDRRSSKGLLKPAPSRQEGSKGGGPYVGRKDHNPEGYLKRCRGLLQSRDAITVQAMVAYSGGVIVAGHGLFGFLPLALMSRGNAQHIQDAIRREAPSLSPDSATREAGRGKRLNAMKGLIGDSLAVRVVKVPKNSASGSLVIVAEVRSRSVGTMTDSVKAAAAQVGKSFEGQVVDVRKNSVIVEFGIPSDDRRVEMVKGILPMAEVDAGAFPMGTCKVGLDIAVTIRNVYEGHGRVLLGMKATG